MEPKEILVLARKILSQRGLAQEVFEDRATKRVCTMGAVYEACNGMEWKEVAKVHSLVRKAINRAIGTDDITGWNDTKGRTKEEVLAAFDKAIEICTS